MKGLIIKEAALFRKNGYLLSILMAMAFSVLFSLGDGTFYLFITPLWGILSETLICDSFRQDKLSGWQDYAEAFPYGKSTIISSKYIAGIINILSAVIIIALSFITRSIIFATFGIGEAVLDKSIYGAICSLAMLIIGNGIVIFIYFKHEGMVVTARIIEIGALTAVSYMFCSSQTISFTPIHSFIFMAVATVTYGVSWKTSERISEKRV